MKYKLPVLTSLVMLLSACGGGGLEGVYKCDGMMELELEFKDGSSGYASIMGQQTTFDYEIEDNKLVLTENGQTNVLSIEGEVLKGDEHAIGECKKI